MAAIPTYTIDGVLPPYTGARPSGAAAEMAPYSVSLVDVIDRFATSPERIAIADGYLRYRADLRASGISAGFQWIDGSFVEDVETVRGRPPNDIDIVTFVAPTEMAALSDIAFAKPELFRKASSKVAYKCDVHFVPLGYSPTLIVDLVRYYLLLFSHQRDTAIWKGLLQVSLDGTEDADAARLLATRVTK